MKKRILVLTILLLAMMTIIGVFFRDELVAIFFEPTETSLKQAPDETGDDTKQQIEVIADNLSVPWGVAFLPNGDILVTERDGYLQRIGDDGTTYTIDGVAVEGEAGLLGVTLHPDFIKNGWLYLYSTTNEENGDGLVNQVDRYRYGKDKLTDRKTIIDNIPGAAYHDGGRLAFGPDGLLYITTGDAGTPETAQDTGSLAGKILRLKDDGTIPSDNPFGNAVYSYGHRNPQGLTWDDDNRLWSTEHGRSGAQSGYDELNLIESGVNYGWPFIQGDETRNNMRPPVVHSGPDETWAPASITHHDGSLYFSGLRGQSLYQGQINGDDVSLVVHFRNTYGRLREAIMGPDGALYITTSNTDGRGQVNDNDDKLLKIPINYMQNE